MREPTKGTETGGEGPALIRVAMDEAAARTGGRSREARAGEAPDPTAAMDVIALRRPESGGELEDLRSGGRGRSWRGSRRPKPSAMAKALTL